MQARATEPLTGSGWQRVSQDSIFPSILRRGKGKSLSSKQAKGRRVPHTLSAGCLGVGCFVLRRATPFSLARPGGFGLEPNRFKQRIPVQSPMGIIPSGMIPHREPRAKSIQYILIKFFRDSGQRGETWGLPSGINHPYSNTPPQTTWFPNRQQAYKSTSE